MTAYAFRSEDYDCFFDTFGLQGSREVPAFLLHIDIIIDSSDYQLSGVVFALPEPVSQLSNLHVALLICVDLSETDCSAALILHDKSGGNLHDFSKQLLLFLHAMD